MYAVYAPTSNGNSILGVYANVELAKEMMIELEKSHRSVGCETEMLQDGELLDVTFFDGSVETFFMVADYDNPVR